MKRMIGFMAHNETKAETPAVPAAVRTNTPVKSLVKIRFGSHSIPFLSVQVFSCYQLFQ